MTDLPVLLVLLDQLPGARNFGLHDVVAEQYGERFVADKIARAPDGMSEPFRFFLTDIVKYRRWRTCWTFFQKFELSFLPKIVSSSKAMSK